MSDKDKKIMDKCGELIPRLNEWEKDRFLYFLDDVTFMIPPQRPAASEASNGKPA